MNVLYWNIDKDYEHVILDGNIGRARICWQPGLHSKTLYKKKIRQRRGGGRGGRRKEEEEEEDNGGCGRLGYKLKPHLKIKNSVFTQIPIY